MGVMATKFFGAMQTADTNVYAPEVCDIETVTQDLVRCGLVVIVIGFVNMCILK
jgi:hypothetical protein